MYDDLPLHNLLLRWAKQYEQQQQQQPQQE